MKSPVIVHLETQTVNGIGLSTTRSIVLLKVIPGVLANLTHLKLGQISVARSADMIWSSRIRLANSEIASWC